MTLSIREQCRVPVFALLATIASNGDAQAARKAIRVADAVTCPECQIVVHTNVTLLAPHDSLDARPEMVRVDPNGRYWVFGSGHVPLLYDSGGRFLRSLGRRGDGPGEFRVTYDLLLGAGDSLVVLDAGNRRATVLTPALRPVRYVALPFHMMDPVVVAWPNAIFSSGSVRSPAGAGLQLHQTSFGSAEGILLRSFGPDPGELRGSESQYLGWHRLSRPKRGRFWSVGMYSYDLFQWNPEGPPLQAIERRPSWFARPSRMNVDIRKEPPDPHVAAIDEDEEGLLWVILRTSANTWREALPPLPEGVREISTRLIAFEKLFATTIEVIDPKTRRVRARTTLNRYFLALLPNRNAVFYEVSAAGEGRIVVGTLELARR